MRQTPKFTPMRRRSTSLCTALLLTAPAAAQLPYAEIVLAEGDPLGGGLANSLQSLKAGEDVGWLVRMVEPSTTNLFGDAVIAGSLDGVAPPAILRRSQVINGVDQGYLGPHSLAGGKIAYLSNPEQLDDFQSAWVDDQRIAESGDPVGTAGDVWDSFYGIDLAVDGSAILIGLKTSPAGQMRGVAVHYPSGDVLLETGVPSVLPPETVAGFSIELSPNGEHWAASVRLSSQRRTIIVDGEPLRIGASQSALVTGAAVDFHNFGAVGLLQSVSDAMVTDHGEVVYRAAVTNRLFVVRGEVAVHELEFEASSGFAQQFFGIDRTGRPLIQDLAPAAMPLLLGGEPLHRGAQRGIDANGNGLVDPSYQFAGIGFRADISGSGQVFVEGVINDGVSGVQSIARAVLATQQELICEGTPNQFGVRTYLWAQGSDRVGYNEFSLVGFNFPPITAVLPLFSRSTGLIPGLGGGMGTLCLGGAIGRSPVVHFSGPDGAVHIDVYLNVLPQPSGPVPAVAGETWNLQCWFRATGLGGSASSNLSNATAVTFR